MPDLEGDMNRALGYPWMLVDSCLAIACTVWDGWWRFIKPAWCEKIGSMTQDRTFCPCTHHWQCNLCIHFAQYMSSVAMICSFWVLSLNGCLFGYHQWYGDDFTCQRCDKENAMQEKAQLENALARSGMDMAGSQASYRSASLFCYIICDSLFHLCCLVVSSLDSMLVSGNQMQIAVDITVIVGSCR